MSACWKKWLIGILSFIAIPLASYAADFRKVAEGTVVRVCVGGSGYINSKDEPNWTFPHIDVRLMDENGNLTESIDLAVEVVTHAYHTSLLSLLMYSKTVGAQVALYNQINDDGRLFDTIILK